MRPSAYPRGQVKLRVTLCLRKETDTKQLGTGQQDQAPVGGPWVNVCCPSWGIPPTHGQCLPSHDRVLSQRRGADLY